MLSSPPGKRRPALTASTERSAAEAAPRLGPRPLLRYLQLAALAAAGGDRTVAPDRFLAGLRAYWRHPYRRRSQPRRVLWQAGSAQLVDFGGQGRPLLVLPSLINRADVLDLLPRRSLLAHLSSVGVRPLLLDWGVPAGSELRLTLADHVHGRAAAALDATLTDDRRAPGAARLLPGRAAGHGAGGSARSAISRAWRCWPRHGTFTPRARRQPPPPPCAHVVLDRHARLRPGRSAAGLLRRPRSARGHRASMPASATSTRPTRRRELFVAIEDWLNDGVPLAGPVAQECLLDWYGANLPGRGLWAPGGVAVRPERLTLPTLIAAPTKDRIVPVAAALALARRLPQADACCARGGPCQHGRRRARRSRAVAAARRAGCGESRLAPVRPAVPAASPR